MKVNIPFVYKVNYKLPRQPSWKHSSILCVAAVEMEEIDSVDAPIVHVVADASASKNPDHDHRAGQVSKFHVPGGDCVVRFHGGQYFASRFPVEEIGEWRGNNEFDPFAVKIGLRDGDSEFHSYLDTSLDVSNSKSLDHFHKEKADVKKFSSERMMTERYINMLGSQFAVVDGVIYEKVREPVISLVVDRKAHTVSVYLEEAISPTLTRYMRGGWRGETSERTRFGLDEYDRAIEMASRWANGRNMRLDVHASVKAVSDMHVRFRGDHEYLFMAAREAAYQLNKALVYLPERVGIAVLSVANLLSVHDRLTPAALAAVRKMEAEFREYFAGDHAAPKQESYYGDTMSFEQREAFRDWKWKTERLSDALAHWDARDDVGLEWLDAAIDALPVYDYPKRAYEVTSLTDIDKLAMKWKGGLPTAIAVVDPDASLIVVVENFEERMPLAAFIYQRNDLSIPPIVFGNPDPDVVASETVLANSFIDSRKAEVSTALTMTARVPNAFKP